MIPGILISCSDLCEVCVQRCRFVIVLLWCLPTVRPEGVLVKRIYLDRCANGMYSANIWMNLEEIHDRVRRLELVQHTLAKIDS